MIFGQLIRDKTTWVGGISSAVASFWGSHPDFFPHDFQGWLAATLTSLTITYMVLKIRLIMRGKKKLLEVAEETEI